MPFSLATNRRPPATAGWARAARTPGNPNAHFNFSFGTSAAVNPPLLAGWNRAFATPAPQPFHDGPELGLDIADGRRAPAGRRVRRAADGAPGDELRHVAPFGLGELLPLDSHAAVGQRVDDRVGREGGERGRVRRARVGGRVHVTRGARPLEHARPARRRRRKAWRRPGGCAKAGALARRNRSVVPARATNLMLRPALSRVRPRPDPTISSIILSLFVARSYTRLPTGPA